MSIDDKICPMCKSKNTVWLLYGNPGPGIMEEVKNGDAILLGNNILPSSPTHLCKRCNYIWGRLDGNKVLST